MDTWVWSIILLLIALAILVVELFVPSGGLLGVLAALAVIGSVVLGYMSSWAFGATMTVVVIVVVPVVIASALKWWPHTPIGRLILNTPPESPDEVLPENDPRYELRSLVGAFAIARTKMLPSGIVRIGDRSYDAVANGQAIEPGQTVRIIGVDLNRLEVSLVDTPELMGSRASEVGQGVSREANGNDLLTRPLDDLGLEPLAAEQLTAEPLGAAPCAPNFAASEPIEIEPRHLLPERGEIFEHSLPLETPVATLTADAVTPNPTRPSAST